MVKGLQYLLVLGIADAVVFAVPLLWTNMFVNAGMVIANFIIIGWVVLKAQRHLDAGRSEMSPYERMKVSRVMLGLVVIMIVPLHEVLGLYPLGYYSASWGANGWTGLINPLIMLIGALVLAVNIQQSRERMGYFAVWRNGALLLLLAPSFAAIQLLLPILIAPEWFHMTVGLLCGTVMLIALLLKGQRDKQFRELEDAIRAGDELAARGQLEEARNRYDVAINQAHTLYSHLIFNPDDPYAQAKVPQSYSEPWFKKGRVLARLGQPKKALAIFDMILEIDPVNQIALLNEAEIMTDTGDFAGALRAVERVLRIVPDHPDALRMRDSIAVAARKSAEQAEREAAAETVFNVGGAAPAGPAPAPAPQTTEFTEAG